MFKRLLKFIKLHKWFHRKSQHYIMGNWLEYEKTWNYNNGCSNDRYWRFIKGYPKAWIIFMWLSRYDILNANNKGVS